jgi:hypothetical protein
MFSFCSMINDAEMVERHGRLLARFADQAASLAEDLHACALAAETIEEKQAIALAFQRTGRALRQTLALEAKLRRERLREGRVDEDRAEAAARARLAARKARVRAGVEQMIWAEACDDDQVEFLTQLEERLETEDLADPEVSFEAHVQRLAARIGLIDPPRQGEVSAKPMEGVEAPRPAPHEPQQSRWDSALDGGAAGGHAHPGYHSSA